MAANNMNTLPARLAALGFGALIAVAGCQNDGPRDAHGEAFHADSDERAVDRFIEVQSAAAARVDATLNGYHFDSSHELNSLGRQKLDLILRDDDVSLPLVVYLDLPRGTGLLGGHGEAVRVYLADRGLAESKVDLRTGPNLDHSRPAKDGLRGLKRLEQESQDTPDSSGTNTISQTPSEMSSGEGGQ